MAAVLIGPTTKTTTKNKYYILLFTHTRITNKQKVTSIFA
jgi:hypothetical protein